MFVELNAQLTIWLLSLHIRIIFWWIGLPTIMVILTHLTFLMQNTIKNPQIKCTSNSRNLGENLLFIIIFRSLNSFSTDNPSKYQTKTATRVHDPTTSTSPLSSPVPYIEGGRPRPWPIMKRQVSWKIVVFWIRLFYVNIFFFWSFDSVKIKKNVPLKASGHFNFAPLARVKSAHGDDTVSIHSTGLDPLFIMQTAATRLKK